MFLLLLGIGFVAGLVTAVSPCVLPVLPILLAGGASGGRRKPFAIVAGLVVSFSVFTLFAAWVLDQLGLPKDLLRNIAIAMLFLIAISLIVPQIGVLIERPFQRLARAPTGDLGGGFLLGLSLGLVFVPCAGPVLAAITVQAATLDFGWRTVLLTFAYALGAAVPMLVVAMGGQRFLRPRAKKVRAALGIAVALATLAIVFNADTRLQTWLSDYTNALQKPVERSSVAKRELRDLTHSGGGVARAATVSPQAAKLPDFGAAPPFLAIKEWINSKPLTIDDLRGKVVLVDFWTYSCINCLRTLPHVKAWYRTYDKDGLVVLGVHTPEFAFEHVPSNVRGAVRRLGVTYPVALDNDYKTWNAFRNQYWPAKYLIDRRGRLRYYHFGEGSYDTTEARIRTLLGDNAGMLPVANELSDPTPTGLMTPESYLGYERLARFAQKTITPDRFATYHLPSSDLQQDELAYGGRRKVQGQRIVAGPDAQLRLRFRARSVHLVLG